MACFSYDALAKASNNVLAFTLASVFLFAPLSNSAIVSGIATTSVSPFSLNGVLLSVLSYTTTGILAGVPTVGRAFTSTSVSISVSACTSGSVSGRVSTSASAFTAASDSLDSWAPRLLVYPPEHQLVPWSSGYPSLSLVSRRASVLLSSVSAFALSSLSIGVSLLLLQVIAWCLRLYLLWSVGESIDFCLGLYFVQVFVVIRAQPLIACQLNRLLPWPLLYKASQLVSQPGPLPGYHPENRLESLRSHRPVCA